MDRSAGGSAGAVQTQPRIQETSVFPSIGKLGDHTASHSCPGVWQSENAS